MDINRAMELIWENRRYRTEDPKAALSHLNEEVAESLKAIHRGDMEKTKEELEDALSCLFIAMRMLELNPEEAIDRQIQQMKNQNEKILVISNNKAEIFVNGVLKGGWSVWSEEDIAEAEKIAVEFGCRIVLKGES